MTDVGDPGAPLPGSANIPLVRDPGLQAERTALSWRRTALAALVVSALFLRQAAIDGWGIAALGPQIAVGVLAVLALGAYRRGRSLRSTRMYAGNVMARPRVMAATSAAVVLAAGAGVLVQMVS